MVQRILAIACVVLLASTIVFGMVAARNGVYRKRADGQFGQRMINAVSSAIDEANRMSGMVTSNISSRLAKVRQYVYYMDQLNALSISLSGGESGRLAPDDAFAALYKDLEEFEAITQQATTSTLDIRTRLLNHLTGLKLVLTGE